MWLQFLLTGYLVMLTVKIIVGDTNIITTEDFTTSTEISTTTLETLGSCSNETNTFNCTEIGRNLTIIVSKTAKLDTFCTCDLLSGLCDINCCCDPDCSPNQKAIFKYCKTDKNMFLDDRFCNVANKNTSFPWKLDRDGLFCVVSRNLPESHLIQKEKPIGREEAFKSRPPLWKMTEFDSRNIDLRELNRSYLYHDSLLVIRNDSKLDVLALPNDNFGLTPNCLYEQDVLYLKNENRQCCQTDLSNNNTMLSFEMLFGGFKIIADPKRFLNMTTNAKIKKDIYSNCPKNVCLELEMKSCEFGFNNCKNVTKETRFRCFDDLKKCENAVKNVRYVVHHNGTLGLTKLQVFVVLKNFTYSVKGNFEFLQQFSIEFIWSDTIQQDWRVLSGNPGYLVGRPVLIGRNTTNNKIELNSPALPLNVEGNCINRTFAHIPIEFGYNLLTKCLVQFNFNISNGTTLCKNMQEAIFDLWNVNESLMFGFYGNAALNNTNDWSKVLYSTNRSNFIRNVKGELHGNTLKCHNMSTYLEVDIFYARIDFKQILNQNKILGIAFGYRNRTVLLDKKALSLSLVSQVTFFDLTNKKGKKLADPPSLSLRLPFDFFYPFIKVGNGGNGGFNVPVVGLVTGVFVLFL